MNNNGGVSKPARIWFATISTASGYVPGPQTGVVYTRGQKELGAAGFEHWQALFYLDKAQRLSWLKRHISETGHFEICRSEAAEEYVWKEDTRIADTQVKIYLFSMNSELSPCKEADLRTGMQYWTAPSPETSMPSQAMYLYIVTTHSLESVQILLDRLESKKKYMCSGVILELVNHEMRGNSQGWELTLRIPEPNGGTATVVRKVLLSTSFVETSTWPTYFDGSTAIRSWWKSKEVHSHFRQTKYGLRAISPPDNGTQH